MYATAVALPSSEIADALRAEGTLTGAAARLDMTLNGLRYRLRHSAKLDALAWEVCPTRRHRGLRTPTEAELMEVARDSLSLDAVAEALDVTRQFLWKNCAPEVWARVVAVVRENRPLLGNRILYDRRPADADASAYATLLRSDPCCYCGGSSGEIDHIEAVSSGGERSWGNLTSACQRCNARKRTTPMVLFMLKRAHGVRKLDDCRG